MPETSRADNMVPRRLFSIIIRLVLIALGILLMWRMVAMLANIPNFDDWPTNENKLEKHGSLKPDIVSDHSEVCTNNNIFFYLHSEYFKILALRCSSNHQHQSLL